MANDNDKTNNQPTNYIGPDGKFHFKWPDEVKAAFSAEMKRRYGPGGDLHGKAMTAESKEKLRQSMLNRSKKTADLEKEKASLAAENAALRAQLDKQLKKNNQ